jgi:hypothetical protein
MKAPQPITGLDGKTYPGSPLTADERNYLIGRTHYLHHHDGLSIRKIAAVIEAEAGLRRSVGTISTYLKYECTLCSGAPNCDT